jgi:hypothetical protein
MRLEEHVSLPTTTRTCRIVERPIDGADAECPLMTLPRAQQPCALIADIVEPLARPYLRDGRLKWLLPQTANEYDGLFLYYPKSALLAPGEPPQTNRIGSRLPVRRWWDRQKTQRRPLAAVSLAMRDLWTNGSIRMIGI